MTPEILSATAALLSAMSTIILAFIGYFTYKLSRNNQASQNIDSFIVFIESLARHILKNDDKENKQKPSLVGWPPQVIRAFELAPKNLQGDFVEYYLKLMHAANGNYKYIMPENYNPQEHDKVLEKEVKNSSQYLIEIVTLY